MASTRPYAGYARELKTAIAGYAMEIRERVIAVLRGGDVMTVEFVHPPVLPCDCVRMIYARMWRAEARDRAAGVIQRAVRHAIQRAQGNPWDLPELLEIEDYDEQYMFWHQQYLFWHHRAASIRASAMSRVGMRGGAVSHVLPAAQVSQRRERMRPSLPAICEG